MNGLWAMVTYAFVPSYGKEGGGERGYGRQIPKVDAEAGVAEESERRYRPAEEDRCTVGETG